MKRWKEWNSTLTENLTVPRALTPYQQPILELTLHAFGDASTKRVSAAVYVVVQQAQGITQQLVCAKSRIAKRNLTIPRLELVAGHMAVNLVTNVQAALSTQPWRYTGSKAGGSTVSLLLTGYTRSSSTTK